MNVCKFIMKINNKKITPQKLIIIFLFIVVIVLIVDYSNILYPISKEMNYDFLNIIINAFAMILVFLLTYIMIDKKISDNAKIIDNNKRNTLLALLNQVTRECMITFNFINDKKSLETFIYLKNNFNNSIEEILKNKPFESEQYIINLFNDGISKFNNLEKYMYLKEKFQHYILLKFTFYNLDKFKEENVSGMYEAKKIITQKLHDDIYYILNSKWEL